MLPVRFRSHRYRFLASLTIVDWRIKKLSTDKSSETLTQALSNLESGQSTVMNINRYVRTYRNGILVAKFRVSYVKITSTQGICFWRWLQQVFEEIWGISTVVPQTLPVLSSMMQHFACTTFCSLSWIVTKEFEMYTTLLRWRVFWSRFACAFLADTFTDRVQHSSFCGFCRLVICWTDQPVNRTGEPSHR